MDDNQNNRINPQDNPFNQSEIDLKEHYDEFGNRIVEQKPAEPSVTEVLEEDLGIVPTDLVNKKPPSDGSLTDKHSSDVVPSFSAINVTQNDHNVNSGVEVGGVEPPLSGLRNSTPHRSTPTLASSIPEKPGAKSSKKIILGAIILIVAAGLGFTLYQTRGSSAKIGVIPTAKSTSEIIKRVGNLVELPISEQPSQIANVSDVARLASNPFFEKAQNGDIVLLYQKNKTAILYRPKTAKIVAIGPLNLPKNEVAGSATGSAFSK